jgi:DEAD/DEAH box helicase domain-containing protein
MWYRKGIWDNPAHSRILKNSCTLESKIEDVLMTSLSDNVLFFDLETQHSFQEVGGRNKLDKLLVSVAVTYSSHTGEFKSYREFQVLYLIEDLFRADTVIGFNIIHFDYRVLKPYTPKDLTQLPTIDMLVHLQERLGFRVSLSSLARGTLDMDKSGDGLQAITWYREGKIDQLITYCKTDVEITRRLYEYGREKGYVFFLDRYSGRKKQVAVDW